MKNKQINLVKINVLLFSNLVVFLISCVGGESKNVLYVKTKDTLIYNQLATEKTEFHYRDSLLEHFKGMKNFTFTKVLEKGDCSVEIETSCLNDTLASSEDSKYEDSVFPLVTRPVIVGQKLIFKRGGITIKIYEIPLKKLLRTNYLGKKIECLKQNIWLAYIVKGPKCDMFGVSGSGLCEVGDCPEFSGFYLFDGSVLYEASTDNDRVDSDEIFKKYGITNAILKSSKDNGIRVDIFWTHNK